MKEYKFRYPHKTDKELKRSIFVYKLITNNILVFFGKIFLFLAIKINLPIKVFTKFLFNQFCGGETLAEAVKESYKLQKFNIKSIPDYSVEGGLGNNQQNKTVEEIIQTIITAANNETIPFAVFKPTGLINPQFLEKQNFKNNSGEIEDFKYRLERIFNAAEKYDIAVLVDAEDYKYQQSIDDILLHYMQRYNKENALIFTTLQMYRTDRLYYFKGLINTAKSESFKLGIKLVRGAYMEKERREAEKLGYEDPIFKTKKETDNSFNKAVELAVKNIDVVNIFCGTHNLESTQRLCDLMNGNNIACNTSKVWFSQLYGMSDELSFWLAEKGYNVAKYLPYGPIRKVIPYLLRRAEENSSINSQAKDELHKMKREIKKRTTKA